MSRRTVALMGVLAALVAIPAVSSAHNVSLPTKISRAKLPRETLRPGQRVIVFGQLTAIDVVCEAGLPVRLMRRVPGNDRVLETDTTDTEGEYSFLRRPRGDQSLYVSFAGIQDVVTGHLHTCAGAVSKQIELNVAG
jgi:hypothetical protein